MSETIPMSGYRGLTVVLNDRQLDFDVPDGTDEIILTGDATGPFIRAINISGEETIVRPNPGSLTRTPSPA
jgi:hypothetical protein